MTDLRKAAKEVVLAWSWDASEPRNKAVREAMERLNQVLNVDTVNMSQERVDETAKREHEPVAWLQTIFGPGGHVYYRLVHDSEMKDTDKSNYTPLYASPPKREWAGLTDEEVFLISEYPECCQVSIRNAEAKLKEKNA
jgi:hypothetical protein